MATAKTRSRFYYPLLGLAAALLVVGLLLQFAGEVSRPALYVIVTGSVVVLVANVREWRHQHARQRA